MATAQELRERRANVWSQMTEIVETGKSEGRDLTAEETEKYDRAEADFDKLEADIARMEKHEARAAELSKIDRSGVIPPADQQGDESQQEAREAEYERVFAEFLRTGSLELTAQDRATLRSGFNADPEIRAAGTGGSAGGYSIPPAWRGTFIETMKWYGPMLDEAEVIHTESGANLPWPTANDTGNVGAILAENTQVTEQDVTLGTASLDAYMYTSKLVRVSFQLIQDNPDFDNWLVRKLAERIGRILNQHFTTGTGSSQPDGIVTSATVAVTGTGSLATTGGFSYANLVDLVESLDPAYGSGPGLKFMGHQTVRKALRKLVDSTGQPLWSMSIRDGEPDTLLGYPFVLNNDMATVANDSKSLGFGNIREAYVARIVRDLSTLRLTERYADYLQVAFLAFERADGTMQNTNAFKVFQTTTTA